MYWSSRTPAKGTGVCGAVTRVMGACNASNACWATNAEMSVATLQRGGASSTTTIRPVFSALSSTVSSSSGDVVRKSTTSHWIPSPASVSAAASERCTISPRLIIDTSSPSRTTFASPNGML